jgi:hypothetical protein
MSSSKGSEIVRAGKYVYCVKSFMYDPTQARTGPCPEQYRSNTCLETRFSLAEIFIFKFPSRITSISKPRAPFPWGVSSARPPTYPRSMMYVFKKIYHPQFSAGHDQSFAPFFSLLSIRNLVRTEIFSRNHKSLRFKLVFRHSNARINMNTNVKTSRTPRSRPRKKGNIVDDLSACKITSPSFSPTQKRKLLPEDGDATGKAGKTPRSETTSIHEGERKINYEIFSCFFAINGCHLSRKFYLRLINVLDNDLMEFDDADDQWSTTGEFDLLYKEDVKSTNTAKIDAIEMISKISSQPPLYESLEKGAKTLPPYPVMTNTSDTNGTGAGGPSSGTPVSRDTQSTQNQNDARSQPQDTAQLTGDNRDSGQQQNNQGNYAASFHYRSPSNFLNFSAENGAAIQQAQAANAKVIVPVDYPNVVIDDSLFADITHHFNNGLKLRDSRDLDVVINLDQIMHRSGVVGVKTVNFASMKWIERIVADLVSGGYRLNLRVVPEDGFVSAPAFSVWVPDSNAEFERIVRKATQKGLRTESWRLVKPITEKFRSGNDTGRKFAFIADQGLLTAIGESPAMRFKYDAYTRMAVIRPLSDAIVPPKAGEYSTKSLIKPSECQLFSPPQRILRTHQHTASALLTSRTPLMNGSARSHRKPIRKPRSAGRRHRTLSSGNINMNLDSLNYVYNVVNYRDIVVNYCDEAPRGCTELKILNKKFGGKLRRDVLNCVAILTDAEGREIGEVNEMNEKIHAVYVGVRGIEGFHPKDYG